MANEFAFSFGEQGVDGVGHLNILDIPGGFTNLDKPVTLDYKNHAPNTRVGIHKEAALEYPLDIVGDTKIDGNLIVTGNIVGDGSPLVSTFQEDKIYYGQDAQGLPIAEHIQNILSGNNVTPINTTTAIVGANNFGNEIDVSKDGLLMVTLNSCLESETTASDIRLGIKLKITKTPSGGGVTTIYENEILAEGEEIQYASDFHNLFLHHTEPVSALDKINYIVTVTNYGADGTIMINGNNGGGTDSQGFEKEFIEVKTVLLGISDNEYVNKSSPILGGNLDVANNYIFSSTGDITFNDHLIPHADNTYDIGSADKKVRDLYVSESSLWVGDLHKVTVSGGKLKFRKRKTSVVPAAVTAAGGDEAGALASAGVGTLGDMKLKHWKAYMRTLGGQGSAEVPDIFRDNAVDYEEDVNADFWVENNAGGITCTTPITVGAITIPNTDGTADQVLKTDGAGALSWTAMGGGGGGAGDITGLSDCLIENNSLYIGNDPSGTTDTAEYNVVVGLTALDAITTGDKNVAIGYDAGEKITTGFKNTMMGFQSCFNMIEGTHNTTFGYRAGEGILGSYNICIGSEAGKDDIQEGSNNILLGSSTDVSSADGTNQIVIGHSATGLGNNKITLGNASITDVYMSQDSGATVHCGAITATGDLSITGDTHTFESANSADPLIIIKNTTNDANGSRLRFIKDKGAAGADNDICGLVEFYGDDDSENNILFAKIEGGVADASNGSERGSLKLYVAENDGNNTAGLSLIGSTTDGEVDVTIGAGADSLTTIAGDVAVTGSVDCNSVVVGDVTALSKSDVGPFTTSIGADGKGLISYSQSLLVASADDGDIIAPSNDIKIPQNSMIKRVVAVVTELSNLDTYNVNLLLSTTGSQTVGNLIVNHYHITGTGSNTKKIIGGMGDLVSALSVEAQIELGTINGVKGRCYVNDVSFCTGPAPTYLYICNSETSNGNVNPTAGKINIFIEYYGFFF